jgi:hypothetical protein
MNKAGSIKNAISMFKLNTASPLIHTKSITPKSAIHENKKFTRALKLLDNGKTYYEILFLVKSPLFCTSEVNDWLVAPLIILNTILPQRR